MRIEWVEWSHLFNFSVNTRLARKASRNSEINRSKCRKKLNIAGLVHGAVFCAEMISFWFRDSMFEILR